MVNVKPKVLLDENFDKGQNYADVCKPITRFFTIINGVRLLQSCYKQVPLLLENRFFTQIC